MPCLNAVIKVFVFPWLACLDLPRALQESLWFHPVVARSFRVARQDDVLPLSKPILTESADMINQVLVSKGTEVVTSIAAYNRDKDLWGEDWRLDGLMDNIKLPWIGVCSNVLIEIQAFLTTLVGKFEFGMTDMTERSLRLPGFVVGPMVNGELDRGNQMPLAISLTPQDGGI
ncbi:hypothetical protein OG21DRAFT_1423884 [Imleria badia]|nr:hypothetical protein OG21DRAFT_1423884 [Imleria badia]